MSARVLTELREIRAGDVVRCTITTSQRKTIHEFPVDRIDGSYVESVTGGSANLSLYFFQENTTWELLERPMPPLPTEPNSVIEILELEALADYDLLEPVTLPILAVRVDGSSDPWITGVGEDHVWISEADITEWRPMKVVPA